MRRNYEQMALGDIYSNVARYFEEEKPRFFRLMEQYIDWDVIIPLSFYSAFYKRMGRERTYSLESFICMLVLQKVFHYTEDSQLLNTLRCSKEMRDFCGLKKVPDASKITRFKQNFANQLEQLFYRLVDLTEPICQAINSELADTLQFDTSGIEGYVAENNPKFQSKLLKQAKAYCKNKPDADPYKMVYKLMPDHAEANSAINQQHINGHFCYAQKFGIVTNGMGIIRHVSLFDEEFKKRHPDMVIRKKSDNPDADKEVGDSTALRPLLNDFLKTHPSFFPNTFVGDSAFDSYDNYALLLNTFNFEKAVVPLNPRNGKSNTTSVEFNEEGTPLCPADSSLPLLYMGVCNGKNRSARLKWVCPKSVPNGTSRKCTCPHPCSSSPYGRTVYTYPHKNLRLYPGIARECEEWVSIYKNRTAIERCICSLKSSFGLSERKTFNTLTTKADLLLTAIVQLIGVLLADSIHQTKYLRRIRKLIS
jgi:hypothetical protein